MFGATSKITAPILQADRNWSAFANKEIQIYPWGDTYACAWFNTFDALQILIKRKYNLDRNYSDRAMAKYTNVENIKGSDPHKNAEILRTEGAPFEDKWPSLRDIASFVAYYTPLPQYVLDAFNDFRSEFTLQHDTVAGGPEAIWDALQYSPVAVSVGWNRRDENEYWFKDGSGPDFHWTVVVGGEYGKYLLAQDSAEPFLKKIRWADFNPQLAKRYDVTKRTEALQISLMQRVIELLKQMVAMLTPSVAVEAPKQPLEAPPVNTTVQDSVSTVPPAPTAPQRVYKAAYSFLGFDLSKKAPDERGCAESVSRVLHAVYPMFPILLSTIDLLAYLVKSKNFREIKKPEKGCVVIMATKGNTIGHTWIWGKSHAMSNTSTTGLWAANYTHKGVYDAAKKRGLPLRFFIPLS